MQSLHLTRASGEDLLHRLKTPHPDPASDERKMWYQRLLGSDTAAMLKDSIGIVKQNGEAATAASHLLKILGDGAAPSGGRVFGCLCMGYDARYEFCFFTNRSPKTTQPNVTIPPRATTIHCDCMARGGRTAARVDVIGVTTPRATPKASQA